jgi:hypothetical protein
MNNLFASWHAAGADVDVARNLETLDLLSRAHDGMAEIPELSVARRLVAVALDHVVEWLERADEDDGDVDGGGSEETAGCGSRLAMSPWR